MKAGSPDRDSSRTWPSEACATATVSGGCREPALPDGQWVLVHRKRRPRRGELALRDCGRGLELHRLGFYPGPRWLHQGDAIPHRGVVRRREILGVVAPG